MGGLPRSPDGIPAGAGERNPTAMAEIKVATDANFEELVLHSDKPTVVDFWATWCGPCRMVAPEMEKLAEKYAGSIDVVKVDVDANPQISQMFNIMSIPTIAFFRPGQQPTGVVGFRPLEQLEAQWQLAQYSKPAEAAPSTPDAQAAS
jgi:thioredoxin 1